MRKKIQVLLNKDKYIIGEPTVGLYWLSLEDPEQFIVDLFMEFNQKVPIISYLQLNNLIQEIFEIEDSTIEKILQNKISNISIEKNKINSFHIVIGQFMKFFGNGFDDTMKMPFRVFQKMLKDIEIISGTKSKPEAEESTVPDKKGLKNLFAKFH